MNTLLEILLSAAYASLFLLLIGRWRFFRIGGIPVRWFQGVFVLKVASGLALYLIYIYYYTDRTTADIWKYFDDGLVMHSALREHPMDYVQMLFGVMNDSPHFDQYYNAMGHWYRPYGTGVSNDTHTIIRFNAAARLISFGCYNVHSVLVNFVGLVGLTGIFHVLRQMDVSKERWFFAAVFLTPGMLFWGSGVLKEPLLLFGLGAFLYVVMRWMNDGFTAKYLPLALGALVVLVTVKSYALMAIVPGVLAWRLSQRLPKMPLAFVFFGSYAVGGLLALGVGVLLPQHNMLQRLSEKQREFNQLASGGTYVTQTVAPHDTVYIPSEFYPNLVFDGNKKQVEITSPIEATRWNEAYLPNAVRHPLPINARYTVLLDYGKTGSKINIPTLDGSLASFVAAMPMAMVNAMFRPFPADINSPFMLMAAAENMLLVVLLIAMMLRFQSSALRHPVLWLSLCFAGVILVLTGLVTPVVGAIVRYKVPALPFLFCAIIALTRTSDIERFFAAKFPFLQKYL